MSDPPDAISELDMDRYEKRLRDATVQELLILADATGKRYVQAKETIATDGPRLRALALELRRRPAPNGPRRVSDIVKALRHAFSRAWVDRIFKQADQQQQGEPR